MENEISCFLFSIHCWLPQETGRISQEQENQPNGQPWFSVPAMLMFRPVPEVPNLMTASNDSIESSLKRL